MPPKSQEKDVENQGVTTVQSSRARRQHAGTERRRGCRGLEICTRRELPVNRESARQRGRKDQGICFLSLMQANLRVGFIGCSPGGGKDEDAREAEGTSSRGWQERAYKSGEFTVREGTASSGSGVKESRMGKATNKC